MSCVVTVHKVWIIHFESDDGLFIDLPDFLFLVSFNARAFHKESAIMQGIGKWVAEFDGSMEWGASVDFFFSLKIATKKDD